ncbi:MAG: CsbD family protein [Bdellovibrionota bacterium]
MINQNIAAGNWTELKGHILSAWGKLTSDELETTKGDALVIAGLVQQKYGIAQEDARKKINDLFTGVKEAVSTPSKES